MPVSKSDKQKSRDWLLEVLKPGDTVQCVLRHVSRSGMQRRIDLFTIREDKPLYLSHHAANALDMRVHERGGIVIGGCGMDMGFALVYELGATLWPKGTDKPHGTRNGVPDTDGGYALKHSWL